MSADRQRVALVTGAARRIGAAIARTLHARAYRVVIHYHRSAQEAEQLAGELNAARADSACCVAQDLAAADCAQALLDAALARWRRLDLLVNNASVFDPTEVATIEPAEWDRIHAINVRAPYFLTVRAAPLLRENAGCVVNIGDVHAERPRAGYSAYCASKAGIVAATRALAIDLAPEVRVNCVSPGAIVWATDESERVRASTIAATPLKRQGRPADIAEAVAYLADAAFVTGQNLSVDGGRAVRI